MIRAVYKARESLASTRAGLESALDERPHLVTLAAGLDMIDELDRRLAAITDAVPIDAPLTKTMLLHDADQWVAVMRLAGAALGEMSRLADECAGIVHERRQPWIRFIARVESDTYAVDTTDFKTVTDMKNWAVLDDIKEPEIRVQFEAERIARAEQAKLHQLRLERMDAAIRSIETEYAQRIRQLPYTVQVPPLPPTPPYEPRTDLLEGLSKEVIHALKTGELPPGA